MIVDLSDAALDELERLEKAATPGEWASLPPYGLESEQSPFSPEDESLLLAARNTLPGLIAEAYRARAAREIIDRYAGIDGEHHKQWVLDQVMRRLMSPHAYHAWVASVYEDGYEWDRGIAP